MSIVTWYCSALPGVMNSRPLPMRTRTSPLVDPSPITMDVLAVLAVWFSFVGVYVAVMVL